ncbi:hypothetical protein NQZ68_007423 [Dissostichus eleginoides]|nr:hypothetical protein NQZ68_007423 [Dissostichus eleginoides]
MRDDDSGHSAAPTAATLMHRRSGLLKFSSAPQHVSAVLTHKKQESKIGCIWRTKASDSASEELCDIRRRITESRDI